MLSGHSRRALSRHCCALSQCGKHDKCFTSIRYCNEGYFVVFVVGQCRIGHNLYLKKKSLNLVKRIRRKKKYAGNRIWNILGKVVLAAFQHGAGVALKVVMAARRPLLVHWIWRNKLKQFCSMYLKKHSQPPSSFNFHKMLTLGFEQD